MMGNCVQCLTYMHDRYMDWKWNNMDDDYMMYMHTAAQMKGEGRAPTVKSIHAAVIDKNPDDVRRILAETPDESGKLNSSGETAAHLACRLGYAGIVDVLMECGCDVDVQTDIGTPIHCILQAVLKNYISKEGGVLVLLKLIQAGCNVNKVDRGGKTALFLAVENDNYESADILISSGAEVCVTQSNGFSPLYTAVIGGNLGCVRLLLNAPLVDVNIRDDAGRTALLAALITIATNFRTDFYNNGRWRSNAVVVPAPNRCRMTSVVEELLKAGADLNAVDNHERNALVLAFQILELDLINCSRNCGCFNKIQDQDLGEDGGADYIKDEKESLYASLTRLLIIYGARFPDTWSGGGRDYTRNPKWMRVLYSDAVRLSRPDAEHYAMQRPNKLSHITRMAIRARLASTESLQLVSELSLPTKLKDYVAVRSIAE